MAIQDVSKMLMSTIQNHTDYLEHNAKLYDINEGNLLQYVDEAMRQQFSPKTYQSAKHRVAPINVLKKIVDKLSQIYQPGPVRSVVSPSDGAEESDSELLYWYQDQFKANKKGNLANEHFNLFKNSLVEILVLNKVPTLRPISSQKYWVFGLDPRDPMRVTHVVIFRCYEDQKNGTKKKIFSITTDEEFAIVDEDGSKRMDLMIQADNPEGINPYGKLNFAYVSQSPSELMPTQDSDTLAMTVLIPILISDLNTAVMFQSFSILYGINMNSENLTMSPNAFWFIKPDDPNSEQKPEIGSIKPEVDIPETLNLIQAELSFWLNTIGIRAGAIGTLDPQSTASGISKMIDEMDTSEARQKQVDYFKDLEDQIWDFVINYGHKYWKESGQIDQSLDWSPGSKVFVNFCEQLPLQSRAEEIKNEVEELKAGLTTKKRAIKNLNPEMTDAQIDELLLEIANEGQITIDVSQVGVA